MINPGFIKGLNIPSDEKDKKTPEWNKKLQRFMKKANKYIDKIPYIWRWNIFDNLEWLPLGEALSFMWDSIVRQVTLRHFRQQLRSGLAYFKQGYYAYDFDSAYAMDIFTWKLERLAKVLDENDRHYGDRKYAKQIREVVRLIERVKEDDYVDEFEKEVAEKYGDDIHYRADTKGFMGFRNKGKGPFKNRHCGAVTMSRREKWTPELDKEINKAERAKYRKAHNKRMREWKKALGMIEKDFFAWWD